MNKWFKFNTELSMLIHLVIVVLLNEFSQALINYYNGYRAEIIRK